MRTTAPTLAMVLAGLAFLSSGGCARAIDPKLVYGTYDVMVSAFGKTDPTVMVADQGTGDTILLTFTQGFTTDSSGPNATGLRASPDSDGVSLDQQPVHVDHSTGRIDGMLTGTGTLQGTQISLTFKVLPSNLILKDQNGNPLPPGSTIDYELVAQRQ